MKKARLILTASMLTIAGFASVTMTSCSKDEVCPAGYEGSKCDVEMRTKFIKSWSASDVVNGNQLVYSCTIAKGLNVNQVTISNSFADNFFDNNIAATVDGTKITIASQKPDGVNSDYSVSGSGSFVNNQITWDYLIVESSTGTTQNYAGTWQ